MDKNNIRDFAIIAHIDHGKSTLVDRFLEITKTISKEKLIEQFLDQNPISRERGITIKLAPVRMRYDFGGVSYLLNLIDTPGHVDFSYEVSRTLAACEGAILLVDATQGVQAQTVAHYFAAKKQNVTILPVVNKIDAPNAQVTSVTQELIDVFQFQKEEILSISAKTGEGVENLLQHAIKKFPPPQGSSASALRCLIFDAAYDEYRGVIAYVKIIDGSLAKGEHVQFFQNHSQAYITEVGYFSPYLRPCDRLERGEIGYVITGVKDIRMVRVGDTIMHVGETAAPLPGYMVPKPMVFLGVFPQNTDDFVHLKESLSKLSLNDTSFSFALEYSSYLGSGYRVGFLGLLHAEIVKERLKREFGLELFFTMPSVLYEKKHDGTMTEPYMLLRVYVPSLYVGAVMSFCQTQKGALMEAQYHQTHAVLSYEIPYSRFIRGLSAHLKSVSSGYASVDYELIDHRKADVVTLEIHVNNNPVDVLSEFVYRDEAFTLARQKVSKLKEALPRQQFRQIIQGVVDGVIVAREDLSPFRKDVTEKLYGGDRTRKDKLLDKQKKGKKRLLQSSKVLLSQEALLATMKIS